LLDIGFEARDLIAQLTIGHISALRDDACGSTAGSLAHK
jgi:hypothetical protein